MKRKQKNYELDQHFNMRKVSTILLIALPFCTMAYALMKYKSPVIVIKNYNVQITEQQREEHEALSELPVKNDYQVCDEVYFDLRGARPF